MRPIRPSQKKARLVKTASRFARDAIGKIEKDCRVIGVTNGQFSIIDIIFEVLRQTGKADVYVSSWTTSKSDLRTAIKMLERGNIRSFALMIDKGIRNVSLRDVGEELAYLGDRIVYTRVHAKFAVIRNDDWNVVVRSSMNFNKNRRIEQFDLDESKEISDFFVGIIESVGGSTNINSALRDPGVEDDPFALLDLTIPEL